MRLDTLKKIEKLWDVNLCSCKKSPIEIKDVGRADLADLLAHLGFNEGAEIGTEEGIYAETLCKANPNLHLICVDPWEAYKGYREHVTRYVMDALKDIAVDRLKPFNVTYLQEYSVDALKLVPNDSLDFVYIDGNHDLRHVTEDLVGWSEKVRSGGIVAGHDFIRRSVREPVLCHVVEAIQAYTSAYHIHPWMVLGTKSWERGETRDKPRSWMWVKP